MITHFVSNAQIKNDDAVLKDPLAVSVVEEMNKKFAVLEQPTFLILEEGQKGVFSLDKKSSFKDRFANQIIEVEGKKRTKSELFLESPNRRTFRKIVMNPGIPGHYAEGDSLVYNLWAGFAVEAKAGCCAAFLTHVYEVICASNSEHYEYLLNLLANWVQRPEERTVAILLRGAQGCGKNIFVDAVGKLFGVAYAVYDDVERLLGRFNSDLATKILIFADEALWGGRKSDSGKLKSAITSNTLWIEPKGKDKIEIPNYRKFIAASNERYALPLDVDDRRWLVLDCSAHRVGNKEYFDKIAKELEQGGYAALLHELQTRNVDGFNPRKLPRNDNAFDLKLQGSSTFIQYLYSALAEERFDLESSDGWHWKEEGVGIRTDKLRDFYRAYCLRERISSQGERECGWILKNLFTGTSFEKKRQRYGQERHPTYFFPPLSISRSKFGQYFHVSDADTIFPKDIEGVEE